MTEKLPQVVRESTVEVLGRTIRVYVLDDGRRIINADDFDGLLGDANVFDATATEDSQTGQSRELGQANSPGTRNSPGNRSRTPKSDL